MRLKDEQEVFYPYNMIKDSYQKIERINNMENNIFIKSVIPLISADRIELKDFDNSDLYFWDIENEPNYDIDNISGIIFVIGRMESVSSKTIKNLVINKNKNRSVYLFDTDHIDKNYADIYCATLAGYIVNKFKDLRSINFISHDKGFESIKFFLETQGFNNVHILQSVVLKQKIDNTPLFISDIAKKYVNQSKCLNKNLLKIADKYQIEHNKALLLIDNYFTYSSKDDKYYHKLAIK